MKRCACVEDEKEKKSGGIRGNCVQQLHTFPPSVKSASFTNEKPKLAES